MTEIIDSGQAGGSDPLADAQNALQSAIAAAQVFNGFTVLIESFVETLTSQQEATLQQITTETITSLERIITTKNDSLREIQLAKQGATLYRPAEHNLPLPGQKVATEN